MPEIRRWAPVVAGAMLVASCSASADPGPTPVIVDYSPTVSDVGALIYLLSHPDVDVIAVTLPVTGEAGCDLGVDVTLGILELFQRSDIAVACDAEFPPDASEWPDAFLAGADALRLGLPRTAAELDTRPAHQLIADAAAESDDPVLVYAVAPLTNIARAIDNHPDLADDIEEIVIMGGAVNVPGNVMGTHAEWNLWIDVAAADRVIGSGIPVTLVPLDATNDVPTPGLWDRDLAGAESEPAQYLSSMIEVFPQTTAGGFYLWDELAAAVAAGEDVATIDEMGLYVSQDPGSSYGATVADPDGSPVAVATSVPDPRAFYSHFLSIVGGGTIEARSLTNWDMDSQPEPVGPGSSPEEVLGFWIFNALDGDQEAAGSVVAPEAPWVGLGDSADVFVAGAAPYQAFDIAASCLSTDEIALCTTTWNDLWIDPNPDLAEGVMRVRALVSGGTITGFEEFSFSPEVAAAFDGHVEWLTRAYPDKLGSSCGGDGASPECSKLLVDTVEEWIAARS